jgi:hypothetical protein
MTTATRKLLALPTAVTLAAVLATPALAATPTIASPQPTVAPAPIGQGIIMRDGGICDPIRHMGC